MDITNGVDISKFTFTNYKNPDGQNHPNCKTYRSTLEFMASETERLFYQCLKNYWGGTEPYKQLTIEYMNLNGHSCTRDLVGSRAEEGLIAAKDAIMKRQTELLNQSKEYTNWDSNMRQWTKDNSVNEDVKDSSEDEYYQYQDKVFEIVKSFGGDMDDIDGYVDGDNFKLSFYSNVNNEVSNYNKKIEKALINYFETQTRFNQWVEVYVTPADKFFYKGPDYCDTYVIEISANDNGYEPYKNNKSKSRVTESNELEQRAKKHKKKSKGRGWHMSVNAGDVEKGIEVFNNSTSLGSGEGTAMGESVSYNTYYYDGPVYYEGSKIADKSDIYTTAKSLNIAIRNVLVKASCGADDLYNYDIVDEMVKQIPKEQTPKVNPKCKICGYELNDIGDCPVCDYGEEDLLESLSSLEALWELSNLD